mgnify:CR=1 FL=1
MLYAEGSAHAAVQQFRASRVRPARPARCAQLARLTGSSCSAGNPVHGECRAIRASPVSITVNCQPDLDIAKQAVASGAKRILCENFGRDTFGNPILLEVFPCQEV